MKSASFTNNSSTGGSVDSLGTDIITSDEMGPFDVMCGRDKECFNNVGNRRFRVMININLQKYMRCKSRQMRSEMILALTRELLGAEGHFRFIRKIKGENRFIVLDFKQSRDKIGHALRDAAVLSRKVKKRAEQRLATPDETTSSTHRRHAWDSQSDNELFVMRRDELRKAHANEDEDVSVSTEIFDIMGEDDFDDEEVLTSGQTTNSYNTTKVSPLPPVLQENPISPTKKRAFSCPRDRSRDRHNFFLQILNEDLWQVSGEDAKTKNNTIKPKSTPEVFNETDQQWCEFRDVNGEKVLLDRVDSLIPDDTKIFDVFNDVNRRWYGR